MMRGGLVYTAAALAPALQGLVAVAVFPRALGPVEYGEYALAAGVAASVMGVSGDWLLAATMRFLPEGERVGRGAAVMKATMVLAMAAGCLGSIVAVAMLAAIGELRFAWLVGVLVMVSALAKVAQGVVRSHELHRTYLLAVVIGSAGSLALGLAGVLLTGRAEMILLGQGFSILVTLLLVWFDGSARSTRSHSTAVRLRRADFRDVLGFGAPVAASAVGGQALQLGDRYVITATLGDRFTGLYAPCYAAGEKLVGLPFGVVFSTYYPIAARMWAEDRQQDVEKLLSIVLGVYAMAGAAIVGVLLVAGRAIVNVVIGGEYVSGWPIVPVVAASVSAWYCGMVFHQMMELEKRTVIITRMVTACAVLNIALNVFLVPKMGIVGSALATSVSYATYAIMAYGVGKHTLGHQVTIPWLTLRGAGVGFCGFIIACLASQSGLGVVASAVLGLSLYCSGLYCCGDRALLMQLLKEAAVLVRRRKGVPRHADRNDV